MLNPKEESVLKLISEDSVYENYFFSNVSNIKWFYPLKEKGYFSPDKVPAPQKAKEGGYYIPEWNVLPYLEQVSKQVDKPENQQYIDELLEIIRNVSKYRDTNGKPIDNYRTWWYFVKILLNFPNDRITKDIIDLIPIWLGVEFKNGNVVPYSKFDSILPGADIGIKSLPQFLDSSEHEDWEKAEKIIEFITAIKWIPKYTGEYKKKLLEEYKPILDKPEKERTEAERIKLSFFNPEEKEPETVLDTYWLLESLRKNADKIAEKCPNVIFYFADNLKQIFKEKLGPAHPTIEFGGNRYQMTIEQPSDFEYSIRIVLEKEVLGKELPWRSETTFELRDCSDKETFVEDVKRGLLQRPDFKDLKDELDEELAEIYEVLPQDASFIWFRNLFSDPEPGIHDTDEALTAILRNIVLEKARQDNEFVEQKIFSEFFGPKCRYPIFRRIALFVIGSEWDSFKDFFWDYIDTDDGKMLFSRDVFEPELYTLLESNVSKFSEIEKEKIKKIIEKCPISLRKRDYNEKQINYWKQKWYSAVKSDSYFVSLYEKQKKTTKTEEELSFKEPEGFIMVSGHEYSPLQTKDILTKSNKDLAVYLKNFKTGPRLKSPNLDALSGVLRESIKENPDKFVEDLKPFLELGYFWVHCILGGISDAWNNKKQFDWKKLFEFINQYINRNGFWNDKFKIDDDHWNADHLWVTGTIGELIQEGAKDDAWAFSEDYFGSVKDILFLILNNLKPKEPEGMMDAVDYALNSAHGKVITALIYLALRVARMEAKKGAKKEIKWSTDIKEKYEKVLHDGIIEAYTLLGQYIGNLSYLDNKWVEQKIQSISYSQNMNLWESFMVGYLWAGKIYKYELMRKHFLTAIDYEFENKHIEMRLVQYICIGYLRGSENLDESSLFGKLLHKWKTSQIEEAIKFFWGHEKLMSSTSSPENKKVIKRIIEFWQWVYKKHYENKASKDIKEGDKAILSNLCLLTIFLPKIDSENFEWLKLSARYVNTRFNSNFFIEYLDRLKDKDTEGYVGEVLLEMLKNYIPYPHGDTEVHIKSIVEHLYMIGKKPGKEKCKESANKICNIYGKNGYDFLRSLYEENNS